ncbi:class I SAM-dependent methyltransferase [Methylocapsa polymorpha]|uniref:Class I SAM-dependent methyltransferase n=1 Tax=Methylocapsa polymorpha TaxID=3080828 RepID=A0ABZ0HQC8_9HYPH|nr:class I SAM-dependent methyltransferase [Methylocapsa sp. RX1]
MGTEFNNDTIEKAYARWAPIYDLVFGALFERARRAAAEAVNRVGGRVLEVGVGTGISLPDYGRVTRVVGVDLSEPMLRKAQEKIRDLHLTNVEGLSVMDAERMAFPDSSFDVIVAQLVVTTVPDPEATLDEFVRVLKPGGEIVLVSRVGADKGPRRVVEQWLTPITRFLGWRLEFPWGRYERWVERSGSVRVVERRAMPPFGHFSLIRFAKTKAAVAQPDRLEAQAAG